MTIEAITVIAVISYVILVAIVWAALAVGARSDEE